MNILFSVLVPTYNQAQYLPQTLDSLLAQQYPYWEAVVVNDGSTDNTAEVMAHYAGQDRRIRTFHKPNGGVSTALNEGLRRAKGNWICWLSSDDLFEPDALAVFAQAIRQNPQTSFFHSHFYELHEPQGQKTAPFPERVNTIPPDHLQTLTFFQLNYVHGISIAIHRSVFEKTGYFDESYPNAQDVSMWMRISALYRLHFINHRTCVTRVHDAMGTQVFPEAGFFDIARSCIDFLNNHTFQQIFPWCNWDSSKDVSAVIEHSLRAGLNPGALMYQGVGFVPAFLERLGEWYTQSCPPAYKNQLSAALQSTVGTLSSLEVIQPLVGVINKMAFNQPVVYMPYDPYELFRQQQARLEAQGQYFQANTIQRYLNKLIKHMAKLPQRPQFFVTPLELDLMLAQETAQNDLPQAIPLLETIVQAHPDSLPALKLLAHAYLLTQQKYRLPDLYQNIIKQSQTLSKQDKAWFENILPRGIIG